MKKWFLAILVVIVSGMVFQSCSDESNPSTPAVNNQPVINDLVASAIQVIPGGTSHLYCSAEDTDGDSLIYSWIASNGTISEDGNEAIWTAPISLTKDTITVIVSDGELTVESSIEIEMTMDPSNPPVIISLLANSYTLKPSENTILSCEAIDGDGDIIDYTWYAEYGSISGIGSLVTWTAPDIAGVYTITCTVSDDILSDSKDVTITVLENRAPVISNITANPATLTIGGMSSITCSATDPDGDIISYTWSFDYETINSSGSTINWKAPLSPGNYTVTCSVSDPDGLITSGSVNIYVSESDPGSVWRIVKMTQGDNYDINFTYDTYGRINTAFSEYGNTTYIIYPNTSTKQPSEINNYSEDGKYLLNKQIFTYENGKVKTASRYTYDEFESVEYQSSSVYTYSQNLLTSEVSSYIDTDWTDTYTDSYSYQNGKLVEIVHLGETELNGSYYDWSEKLTVEYIGDELFKTNYHYLEMDFWFLHSYDIYEYQNDKIHSKVG
jgi:hypothetical protein